MFDWAGVNGGNDQVKSWLSLALDRQMVGVGPLNRICRIHMQDRIHHRHPLCIFTFVHISVKHFSRTSFLDHRTLSAAKSDCPTLLLLTACFLQYLRRAFIYFSFPDLVRRESLTLEILQHQNVTLLCNIC